MMEEKEIWNCHYEAPKKHINLEKLWRIIETVVIKKLDLDLTELWLNYLLNSSCYCGRKKCILIHKDSNRRENE